MQSTASQVSVLWMLLFLGLATRTQGTLVSLQHRFPPETGLVSTHVLGKAYPPLSRAVLQLWAPVKVTVNCSSAAYVVLTADSLGDLLSKNATRVIWCGWRNIISEPNVCQMVLSPMKDTYFAVEPKQSGLLSIGQPELQCEVTAQPGGFVWRSTAAVAAVLLYTQAGFMATSPTFRLTSGGLLGITGFAVIFLMIIVRNTPAKRAIGAGFALSASGMLALIRWVYGTWAPGVQQVLFSRVGAWYILLTGAAGVAVTYWLDDPANEKINTSIRVGLKGIAIALLYASIADEYVAVGAILLLLTHGWLLASLSLTARITTKLISWSSSWIPSKWKGDDRYVALPDDWSEPSYHSSQDSDYSPSRDEEVDDAFWGPEDDRGGGVAEEDEDGPQFAAPAAGRAAPAQQRAGGLFMWRPAAAAAAAGGVAAQHAAGQSGEDLGPAPSFDRWAQQPQRQQVQSHAARAAAQASLAGAAGAGNAGAGRHAGPAPGGWGAPLLALDRAQGRADQQLQQQAADRPSSTSPWSERKVLDLTQPKVASPPAAGAGISGQAGVDGFSQSPLVRDGRIINPESGRAIAINGATYHQLMDRGFQPDFVAGTMVLSPGGAPAALPAGHTRGAPSPAGNLRARKSSRAV